MAESPLRDIAKSMALFQRVLVQIIGCTGVGLGLTYLLVWKFGFPKVMLLVGGLGGFGLALFNLYRTLENQEK